MKLDVICLEEPAFFAIIDRVYDHLKSKNNIVEDIWIALEDAMRLLGITSKTILQKYRDEGKIGFSQPSKKIILYDRSSILKFLDSTKSKTF